MNDKLERSLILLKPDAIDRGLVGEIIHRFERVGLKLAGLKLVWSDKDTALKHYSEDLAERRGQKVRDIMVEMITSGPTVAIAVEGVEAVEVVRKMVGATEPKSAAPGTIRGDYAHLSFKHADANEMAVFNLIHASASVEEANDEISYWFQDFELHSHQPDYTKHTLLEK
ncbi:nucleoside-diphosphate kinase [Candidatus Parcubacteria bacterium]|jgi:nucleoside-diphosphate kinase|nr:nucleoside-diphosphate kinase [bacterium]MBT6691794.1 nucleoside-diphosphate kinase [Candidatus Parcubacteria bacterium]